MAGGLLRNDVGLGLGGGLRLVGRNDRVMDLQ
jgi:hypothetical protein